MVSTVFQLRRSLLFAGLAGLSLALPGQAAVAQGRQGQDERGQGPALQVFEQRLLIEQLKKEVQRLQEELKNRQPNVDTALIRKPLVPKNWEEIQLAELRLSDMVANDNPGLRNPRPVLVKGTIDKIDPTNMRIVRINLGQDHGVRKNHTLEVYRITRRMKYLGRIVILDAEFRHSIGRLHVVPGIPPPELLPGDWVATKLPQ
jgi:hypothetical protein